MTRTRRNLWRRLNYEAHLWLGLLTAMLVVVVCVTGIILNHKRAFGVMSEPDHSPGAALATALPLERLVQLAVQAFNHPEYPDETSINRMDFRPNKGYVKVRKARRRQAAGYPLSITKEERSNGYASSSKPCRSDRFEERQPASRR